MPGCADAGFAINGLTLAVPEALVTMALPLYLRGGTYHSVLSVSGLHH
jgi:hypothetical protein